MASAPSTAPRSTDAAPQTSASASSQPAVDVTAVTTRDDFLLELGETLDGQAAVRPVDTLEAALEGLATGKRAQLLVIDARAVPNLRAAVDAAAARAPRTLVLVFAEAAAEKQVGAALKGSKVFAVLPTPVDPRKTQAVFEGAIAEALAARATAAPPRAASAGGSEHRRVSRTLGVRERQRPRRSGWQVQIAARGSGADGAGGGRRWFLVLHAQQRAGRARRGGRIIRRRAHRQRPRRRRAARRLRRLRPRRSPTPPSWRARSMSCWRKRASPCTSGASPSPAGTMHFFIIARPPPPMAAMPRRAMACSAWPRCWPDASMRP